MSIKNTRLLKIEIAVEEVAILEKIPKRILMFTLCLVPASSKLNQRLDQQAIDGHNYESSKFGDLWIDMISNGIHRSQKSPMDPIEEDFYRSFPISAGTRR